MADSSRSRPMRLLTRILGVTAVLLIVLVVGLRVWFGGSQRLEDRTTAPMLPASALEVVADLDYPPGNIAVSKTGRVFFTFHPDGNPPTRVAELRDGKPVPYPDEEMQHAGKGAPHFDTVLSLRIDQ